jgi:phosphoribosylanthranilate isomerase
MTTRIKICGLSTPEMVDAALAAGADWLGFVFYEPSPRHIGYEMAARLNARVAGRAQKVALTVNADDARLAEISSSLDPDWYQLHGREMPERVREIRARFGRPVIKAIHVACAKDTEAASAYIDVADMLLYDAKAPAGMAGALPGGNGMLFDWSLIGGERRLPVMLSGGLDPDNVADAIRIVRPDAVDVSSGVERRPGEKDPDRIALFVERARSVQ